MGVVERYLAAVASQDWDAFGACVTDDVHRIGPFGDEYQGKGPYTAFLRGLMPTLAGYRMEVDRVVDHGSTAFAELTETIEMDGRLVRTPECLVFDLAPGDRIRRIAIYIRQP